MTSHLIGGITKIKMSNIFIVAFVLSPIVIQAIECNSVQQTDQAETRLIDLFVHIVNTKITNIKSYYEQLNTHHLADHDYNNDSDNAIQNRTIPALLNLDKLNTLNDVNEKSQSNSPTSRDNFLVLLLNPNSVLNQSQIDNLRAQYERSLANTYQLERVLYAFAYSLIIVSSFFGNLLVCRVCLLNMSRTNALIMSLAVSDLAMTIFNIPFNYFRLLNYSWPFGSVICFVVNFVQHLVVYSSSYTMAIIAIQRYYSVCCLFPFQSKNKSRQVSFQNKYDNICSMRTIVMAILITWTVSAVISTFFTFNSTMVVRKDTFAFILAMYILKLNKQQTPLAVQPESVLLGRNFNQTKEHLATVHNFITYRCANLVPDSVEQFVQEHFSIKADFAKSIAVFATQYFIPLFVSCCLYIRIGKTISRQGKMANLKENPKSQMAQKMKRRRICMLVLVVALFAICWLPLHTFHLLTDAGLVNFNYQIFMMVHWIAMSSVCYNPFIYCWLNKNFRNGAIRVFCGCCQTRAGQEIRTTNGNRTSTTIDISEINRSSFELTKLPNGIQEKLLKQVGLLKPPSHIRSGNAITGTTTSITITTSTNNQIANANHERHNSLLITDL